MTPLPHGFASPIGRGEELRRVAVGGDLSQGEVRRNLLPDLERMLQDLGCLLTGFVRYIEKPGDAFNEPGRGEWFTEE